MCQLAEGENEQRADKALFHIVTIAICPNDINILIYRVSKKKKICFHLFGQTSSYLLRTKREKKKTEEGQICLFELGQVNSPTLF